MSTPLNLQAKPLPAGRPRYVLGRQYWSRQRRRMAVVMSIYPGGETAETAVRVDVTSIDQAGREDLARALESVSEGRTLFFDHPYFL